MLTPIDIFALVVVMAIGLAQLGFFSWEDILISSVGIALVFLGLRVGTTIRHLLSEKVFHNAILGMLTVMGISLILPILNS